MLMFVKDNKITYIHIPQNNGAIMQQTLGNAQFETMLTGRQVADFIQVSIYTIRRWSNSGMLNCYRVGARGDRRYRREDILRFMQSPGNQVQGNHPEENVPHPHNKGRLSSKSTLSEPGKRRGAMRNQFRSTAGIQPISRRHRKQHKRYGS